MIQSIHDNKLSFGAKLVIKDKGKFFSFIQKRKLTKLAKTVGTNSDCLLLGTRKYKTRGSNSLGEEIFWDKTDILILSLIGDAKREIEIPFKTIKILLAEQSNLNKDKNNILCDSVKKIFKDLASNSKENSRISSKENLKDLKTRLKLFCSLKCTYHKETLLEKYQKFMKIILPKTEIREKETPKVKHEPQGLEPWEYRVQRWNREIYDQKHRHRDCEPDLLDRFNSLLD